MTNEELRTVVSAAVREGVQKAFKDPDLHCRYDIDADAHRKQHEALERFITLTGRIDNLKWTVLQKIAVWVLLALGVLMAYGAVAGSKLKDFWG